MSRSEPPSKGQAGGTRKKLSRAPEAETHVELDAAAERAASSAAADVARPSPTDRLANLTRERIDALEADKATQRTQISCLLDEIRELREAEATYRAEGARLNQAIGDISIMNGVATTLIAIGGVLVSYASFINAGQKRLADFGLGILGCGVVIFLANTLMGRLAKGT